MKGKQLLLFLLLIPKLLLAQDPQFSQFFANPLFLNPAFTGTYELPRVAINYRNQWPAKGQTFTTYSIAYDMPLKKYRAGIGFQLYRDNELSNVIQTSNLALSYSYHIKLSYESFISLGLNAGFTLKQFDLNGLIFPSEINQLDGSLTHGAILPSYNEKRIFPDFGVGALAQHHNFFWGASVQHINQAKQSLTNSGYKGKLPLKITLHAGAQSKRLHHGLLSREFTLSPNILYQQQGSFKQLNIGIYMIEKSIVFGGWFRNNIDIRPNAIIALIGFSQEKFQIGYSFDYTLSELSNYSHGSHEISITLLMGKKSDSLENNKLLIPII